MKMKQFQRGKCGKRCFSERRAQEILKHAARIGRGERRMYFCHKCKAHHLTSQAKRG